MRSGGKRTDSELPDVDHAFVVLDGILGYRPGFRMRNQRATHVDWTRARMVRAGQGDIMLDVRPSPPYVRWEDATPNLNVAAASLAKRRPTTAAAGTAPYSAATSHHGSPQLPWTRSR